MLWFIGKLNGMYGSRHDWIIIPHDLIYIYTLYEAFVYWHYRYAYFVLFIHISTVDVIYFELSR